MNDLLHAIGASLGGLMLFGALFSGAMVVFGFPILAFRGVRHLRHISEELARLNETLTSKITITKSGPLGLS